MGSPGDPRRIPVGSLGAVAPELKFTMDQNLQVKFHCAHKPFLQTMAPKKMARTAK